MKRFPTIKLLSAAITCLLALTLTGCPAPNDADADHDHGGDHDHGVPTTLAEAHEALEHMSGEIKAAFEAGKPADADNALHDIGHVIAAIPKLAETLGGDAKQQAKQVHDDLMDSFATLHDGMHGPDGATADWATVSEKVDAAMATLKSWLPDGTGHDHDGHDHDGDDHDGDDHDGEEAGHDHADHDHADHDHADADHADADHDH